MNVKLSRVVKKYLLLNFSVQFFIPTAKICSTGRTQQEFEDEGTGTELIIQTGQTPSSLLTIPREAEQATENTPYEQGLCVTGMGGFCHRFAQLQLHKPMVWSIQSI